jgi:INTU/CCZ1/HPS4 family protein
MHQLWIIEKKASRLLYYHSNTENLMDQFLVSGLLSAFNMFSESELDNKGVENIDMGGLRWVYLNHPDSNLFLVTAVEKTNNSALILARLEIIYKMFVNTYGINEEFWETEIDFSIFRSFDPTIELLHNQWETARKKIDEGKIFDLLGVFQNIFLKLIDIINDNFKGEQYKSILVRLNEFTPKLEKWYQEHEDTESFRVIKLFFPRVDLKKFEILFDSDSSLTIFGLNPIGINEELLIPMFFITLNQFSMLLERELGKKPWLSIVKDKILPFLFKNWAFLDSLNILKEFFQTFLE